MSRRIFVTVTRGMTDKTAVCVFPWEKPILELIHGGDVREVSVDEMCSLQGAIKVEKAKVNRQLEDGGKPEEGLSLRQQLEAMTVVEGENDPADDPGGEYERLVNKYGMDKEIPLPCVTRVYGEFNSGAFTAALKQAQRATVAAPKAEKGVESMSINELRSALRAAGIDFDQTATKVQLRDLLATATA